MPPRSTQPCKDASKLLTPARTVDDEPTIFEFDGREYQPANFEQDFYGHGDAAQSAGPLVECRHGQGCRDWSAIKSVVDMARRAGLNDHIEATPAVALGAYDTTPLEIAGAYTMFANGGVYVKPSMLATVRSHLGRVIYQHAPETRQALDPRVAYLMVNMMEEVLRTGTGAGARSLGFRAPAAGKTGTSRDGWFAGFTSDCWRSFGWASTTIVSSNWKEPNPRCRSGPSS